MAAEQGTFQRGVIAEHHRKGVEREDVAGLDQLVGDRIMCPVGVDAGLEPGPCVHQLDKGKAFGNAAHHGGCRGQRDFMLGDAGLHRRHQRPPANSAHFGALADQNMLLGRLDGPQRHRDGGTIDQLDPGEMLFKQGLQIEADLVELDAKTLHPAKKLLQRGEIAVTPPVGIGDIVADRAPPGLPAINRRRHGGHAVAVQNRAITASELAIEEARKITDVVIGGEKTGIDAGLVHQRLHRVAAT